MKSFRIVVCGLGLLFSFLLLGCESSRSSDTSSSHAVKTNLDFLGGVKHLTTLRPAATASPETPVITDTAYYPILRQGGDLDLVVTFDDDSFAGVTTLIFQLEGSPDYFSFPVVPLQDPLSPGVITVNLTAGLDPHFRPGTYTLYMGLLDEDGNVSAYVSRLLVVKSLAELEIAELIPANGATGVAANTLIQARLSQQVFAGEAEIILKQAGQVVPGSLRLSPNGRTLYFHPDELLESGGVYAAVATILVNGKSSSASFTVSSPPALTSPGNLPGAVLGILLTKDSLVEPEEGKMVFDLLTAMPPFLIKVTSLDQGTGVIQTVGALGADDGGGGWVQSNMVPAFGPNSGAFANPWLLLGPAEVLVPLADLGIPGSVGIHELMISGSFTQDAGGAVTGLAQGALTGRIDSQEINPIISQLMGKSVDLCELVPLCDQNGMILIRAEGLAGFVVPGIDYLYGIKCGTDPTSVNAASGGSLMLTCETRRDGQAFQGNDISFSAKTWTGGSEQEVGTWDILAETCAGTPPVCSVPPSGRVTLKLNLDPAELVSGDLTFRLGGAYSAPPGPLSAAVGVAVE